jgi:hypothetical protein
MPPHCRTSVPQAGVRHYPPELPNRPPPPRIPTAHASGRPPFTTCRPRPSGRSCRQVSTGPYPGGPGTHSARSGRNTARSFAPTVLPPGWSGRRWSASPESAALIPRRPHRRFTVPVSGALRQCQGCDGGSDGVQYAPLQVAPEMASLYPPIALLPPPEHTPPAHKRQCLASGVGPEVAERLRHERLRDLAVAGDVRHEAIRRIAERAWRMVSPRSEASGPRPPWVRPGKLW